MMTTTAAALTIAEAAVTAAWKRACAATARAQARQAKSAYSSEAARSNESNETKGPLGVLAVPFSIGRSTALGRGRR